MTDYNSVVQNLVTEIEEAESYASEAESNSGYAQTSINNASEYANEIVEIVESLQTERDELAEKLEEVNASELERVKAQNVLLLERRNVQRVQLLRVAEIVGELVRNVQADDNERSILDKG